MRAATVDLFEAIKKDERDLVAELLAQEPAAAGRRDERGLSAVLLACYYGRPEIVAQLLAARPELDVFEAAATGTHERVDELLDEEPELVRAWSSDGFTALHLASFFGHAEAAELLLERGADVTAVSRNELTVMPLHSAAASRHTRIARLLIEHGADLNAAQEGGFTPLHEAAQNGDRDLVELLLAEGADPGRRLHDGRLPVELAHEHGHEEVAALLRREPRA
jgi:uncharacterized protein